MAGTSREPGGGRFTGSRGFTFAILQTNIYITKLGLFDGQLNGFDRAHEVAIWSDPADPPLYRATIEAGVTGELIGEYRYVPIPPLFLEGSSPGKLKIYAISTFFNSNDPDNMTPTHWVSSKHIFPTESYGTSFNVGEELAYPAFRFAVPCEGCGSIWEFQPNFRYEVVPEPGTWTLLGLGFGLAAVMARRKVA